MTDIVLSGIHMQDVRVGNGRLVINTRGRVVVILLSEIEWLEAKGNYVRIQAGAELHRIRGPISRVEQLLPPSFTRIHRCIIVNTEQVRLLRWCNGAEYVTVLRSGKELPVSKSYRKAVSAALTAIADPSRP